MKSADSKATPALTVTKIADSKPDQVKFQVELPAASELSVYVRQAGKPLATAMSIARERGTSVVTLGTSDWPSAGKVHVQFEARDADDQLLAAAYVSLDHVPDLARLKRAGAGGTPQDVHIVLDGDLQRVGELIELKLMSDDCNEVDPGTVTYTVTVEDDERCCQEIPVSSRTSQGVRSQRFMLPAVLSAPFSVNVQAQTSFGVSVQNVFPVNAREPLVNGSTVLDGSTSAPVAPPTTSVSLRRAARPATPNQDFYSLIRASANALSFDSYQLFLDLVFCGEAGSGAAANAIRAAANPARSGLALPFPGVDAYRTLKAATEVFILINSGAIGGSVGSPVAFALPNAPTLAEEEARMGHPIVGTFEDRLNQYLTTTAEGFRTLPYLDLIRRRLSGVDVVQTSGANQFDCQGIIQAKLTSPLLIELIHEYWLEEGGLVQTMLAISQRFQNRHAGGERDPLAQLEIDPLRPFSNVLWGYVQDEQHRLSVVRRAHEYAHHYGMPLQGKAVRGMRPADHRSKFLEAFHNLLYQAMQFYRQDDDTTMVADGFGVLNTLKETHYVLAQGAHNQFGDLPSTARQEMLIEQFILSRPEVREFLGGRIMVPYPEPWMDRVDTVKTLKGWTDVSVVHFRDLAVFGEQILLSVRWDAWSTRNDPELAANWARYWRPEVQGYIHAYRAVTGIDLSIEIADHAQLTERYLPPSVHLARRLGAQARVRV